MNLPSTTFELGQFDSAGFIVRLLDFPSVRSALQLLFQVILQNQSHISCWSLVFFVLGVLRDSTLLPPQMVVEGDSDLLPVQIRNDFELRLAALDRAIIEACRPAVPSLARTHTKSSPSLLSLQGLGEALFGGAELPSEPISAEEAMLRHADSYMADSARRNDLPSARWDTGYEDCDTSVADDPTFRAPAHAHSRKSVTRRELR